MAGGSATGIVALAVSACLVFVGSAEAGADPGSRDTVPTASQADEQPSSNTDTVFTDSPHLVKAQPLAFRTWSRLPDADAVRVHFTAGTPQCYGVHATVQETDQTVQVALLTGTLPGSADRMCIAVAVLGALDVPLSRPLGARDVISVT